MPNAGGAHFTDPAPCVNCGEPTTYRVGSVALCYLQPKCKQPQRDDELSYTDQLKVIRARLNRDRSRRQRERRGRGRDRTGAAK